MSPLALCDGCPTEFTCIDEGCRDFARRAGPRVITLNDEQWEHFMREMQTPRKPTPSMIEAARKMKEWAELPGKLEYESWFARNDGDKGE